MMNTIDNLKLYKVITFAALLSACTADSGFTDFVRKGTSARDIYSEDDASVFSLNDVTPKIYVLENNNKVTFNFANPNYGEVNIRIFNMFGSMVRTNIDVESESVMSWDGTDEKENRVNGGLYFYQVEADGLIENGSIVVVR